MTSRPFLVLLCQSAACIANAGGVFILADALRVTCDTALPLGMPRSSLKAGATGASASRRLPASAAPTQTRPAAGGGRAPGRGQLHGGARAGRGLPHLRALQPQPHSRFHHRPGQQHAAAHRAPNPDLTLTPKSSPYCSAPARPPPQRHPGAGARGAGALEPAVCFLLPGSATVHVEPLPEAGRPAAVPANLLLRVAPAAATGWSNAAARGDSSLAAKVR